MHAPGFCAACTFFLVAGGFWYSVQQRLHAQTVRIHSLPAHGTSGVPDARGTGYKGYRIPGGRILGVPYQGATEMCSTEILTIANGQDQFIAWVPDTRGPDTMGTVSGADIAFLQGVPDTVA